MATSKTIAVTGQTVSIPAMTDVPDMSVASNVMDKTIDAVNKSAYTQSSSIASQSALDTLLTNALDSAATNTEVRIRFTPSATFGLFVSGEVYFADIKKAGSANYSTAIITRTAADDVIKATKNTSGWTYSTLLSGAVPPRSIPNNSDLDSYTTPGTSFNITNAGSAVTIAHVPVTTSGGRLDVIGQYSASTFIRQIYMAAVVTDVFTRVLVSGTWGKWYKFDMTEMS